MKILKQLYQFRILKFILQQLIYISLLKLENGKKDVELFYKECIPKETGKGVLWLLHGAAFTSNTWQKSLPTIQTICELGYRVVAIDIPGLYFNSIRLLK